MTVGELVRKLELLDMDVETRMAIEMKSAPIRKVTQHTVYEDNVAVHQVVVLSAKA